MNEKNIDISSVNLQADQLATDGKTPMYIAVDNKFDGIESVAEWLSQKRGNKVNISVPQRGEQAHLVAMSKRRSKRFRSRCPSNRPRRCPF